MLYYTHNVLSISILNLEEKVDVSVLKIIKQHQISKLLQQFKIGDQILFEHHLEIWRNEQGVPLNFSSDLLHYCFQDQPDSPAGSSVSHVKSVSKSTCSSPVNSRDFSSPEPADTISVTLSDILNESHKGTLISEFYSRNLKLDEEQRSFLIDAIANFFERKNLHMTLATSYRLEKEIVDRFPNEKVEFYRSGKRGKIYVKFCNMKSRLRTLTKMLPRSKTKDNTQETASKTFGKIRYV